jgi:hypothetical protein
VDQAGGCTEKWVRGKESGKNIARIPVGERGNADRTKGRQKHVTR